MLAGPARESGTVRRRCAFVRAPYAAELYRPSPTWNMVSTQHTHSTHTHVCAHILCQYIAAQARRG